MKHLVAILLDPNAEFGDRDDAAIAMADSDDPDVVRALLEVALDAGTDEDLADRVGESLWTIWRRSGETHPELVNRMHPAAKKFFDLGQDQSVHHASDNIQFPAIWIAREGTFGVAERPMDGCSYVAFKKGFFEGLRFFDASGSQWTVVAATPKRQLSPLDRWLNRRLEIDVQLGQPVDASISEVVDLICSCIDRDPDDLHDQFASRDESKDTIRCAKSIPDLIARLQDL